MRTLVKGLLVVMIAAACPSEAQSLPTTTTDGSATTSSTAPTTTSGPPTQHVHWLQQGPPVTPGAPACDAAGGCVFPFEQRATLTGDVSGSSVGAGTAALPPNGREKTFAVTITTLVRGSFGDCGQGVAVVRRWETVDPETGAGSGQWEIVGAVGSDGIATVSGGGTIAPPPPNTEGEAFDL